MRLLENFGGRFDIARLPLGRAFVAQRDNVVGGKLDGVPVFFDCLVVLALLVKNSAMGVDRLRPLPLLGGFRGGRLENNGRFIQFSLPLKRSTLDRIGIAGAGLFRQRDGLFVIALLQGHFREALLRIDGAEFGFRLVQFSFGGQNIAR